MRMMWTTAAPATMPFAGCLRIWRRVMRDETVSVITRYPVTTHGPESKFAAEQ